MSSVDKVNENTAHIATKGSSALDGVGTNPTGKKLDENTAHVDPHKGSTALDGVGVIPDNIQKDPIKSQPQPKNTSEYVTGVLENVYTAAKDTLLGTIQSAKIAMTDKVQDQKSEEDKK